MLGNYSHNFQNLANVVLTHPIPIGNIYHKYYDYTIIDLRVFFQYLRGKLLNVSNSQYETDFGISSAFGAGNTKIGFLKVRQRRTFKKPIFIMIIAVSHAKE